MAESEWREYGPRKVRVRDTDDGKSERQMQDAWGTWHTFEVTCTCGAHMDLGDLPLPRDKA